MYNEYEKLLNAAQYSRTSFLEFVSEFLDEKGEVDFEKLESSGKMHDYDALAKNSTECSTKLKIFEDYLIKNGKVEPTNKDAIGMDLDSQIQKLKDHNGTLADMATPKLSTTEGSRWYITMLDKQYEVTEKSIDEQVEIYKQAISNGFKQELGMNEAEIQKACAEMFAAKNDLTAKYFQQNSR